MSCLANPKKVEAARTGRWNPSMGQVAGLRLLAEHPGQGVETGIRSGLPAGAFRICRTDAFTFLESGVAIEDSGRGGILFLTDLGRAVLARIDERAARAGSAS